MSRRFPSRTCVTLIGAAMWLLAWSPAAAQPRFYPDDPLPRELKPVPAADPQPRALSVMLEAVGNVFGNPGERHPIGGVIPAGGVNTLDEVMDGDWYENRHWMRRRTIDELTRGAGTNRAPSPEGNWQVLVVKPAGERPGLVIVDAKNDLYLLRFDPQGWPEVATGAEMVTSRFYHALGYHVGETYLARVERHRLVPSELGLAVSSAGNTRTLIGEDIDGFLRDVAHQSDNSWRAVALRVPVDRTRLLGPYQLYGTRSDDPNDLVPHEHRRDLRGLFVFAAWLNHASFRAVDTADLLVETDGVVHIRHHMVDFGKSLGASMLDDGAKRSWEGRETFMPSPGTIAANAFGLGLYSRNWMRVKIPDLPGAGRLDSASFDPERWTTYSELAPFANRLPDDTFWAAKQVMAFTDEEIRAIVATGGYSDSRTIDWITKCLIERRNAVGRTYLSRVLPLDKFRIENETLRFDDIAAQHGFQQPVEYVVGWHSFDNSRNQLATETLSSGATLPAQAKSLGTGAYIAARIAAKEPSGRHVTVFVRKTDAGFDVVGIERHWSGKVVADRKKTVRGGGRFPTLAEEQKELFGKYAAVYNKGAGLNLTPEQAFDALSLSEQTTFDAVTHALFRSTLTDAKGQPLGRAFDLVAEVERIAGQYAGRRGDEQFRLFVRLTPGARDTLERSREFYRHEDNTVFHVGYPYSFRQDGKEPTLQISLTEDGTRADIDVDYRSSKSPQSLFNGHLSSANSDVRSGKNPARHDNRWTGFVPWWQEAFGRVREALGGGNEGTAGVTYRSAPEIPTPLPPDRPPGASPDKIEDAVQEFLTDWLVRREYDEALQFLSARAFACVNVQDNGRTEPLDTPRARTELRRLMSYAADQMGKQQNLTLAIAAVTPPRADRTLLEQPFAREFAIFPIPEPEARPYLCGQAPTSATGAKYFAVLLTPRKEGSGILGLLWIREADAWRMVAYRTFAP